MQVQSIDCHVEGGVLVYGNETSPFCFKDCYCLVQDQLLYLKRRSDLI